MSVAGRFLRERQGDGRCLKLSRKFEIPKSLPELVIMPVFNEFAGGISLNSERSKGFLGPLAKCSERENAGIYLLDGTFLGELGKL